jgi:hypothetical protein
MTAMTLPLSLNPIEFELLIGIAFVLILVALFLVLLLSAIIGAGIARLLYLVGSCCVRKLRHSWSEGGARTVNVVGRIVS